MRHLNLLFSALLFFFITVKCESVVINEVLGSTTGPDAEFIELYGTPGTTLQGLSLIIVEGDNNANFGNIDRQIDFDSNDFIFDNGFFLLGNSIMADIYNITPNKEISTNYIENSSYTIALVQTSSITGSTVTGNEIVLDAVGVWDGDDNDIFYFNAPVVGPDGPFVPAGVGRISDGVDTNSVSDWSILSFFHDMVINKPTAGEEIITEEPTMVPTSMPTDQGDLSTCEGGKECKWRRNRVGCMSCRPFYDRVLDDDTGLYECERNDKPTQAEINYACGGGCASDNCLEEANIYCQDLKGWGCKTCQEGYFRKNNDHLCVSCGLIPNCQHCNADSKEWGGCDICETGYEAKWDFLFGYKRCQPIV